MNSTSNSRGFTLVEMAIVMVIVGLLAGIAFPTVSMLLKRGEAERERAALIEAREALLGHVLTNSGLPAPYQFSTGHPRTHIARDVGGLPQATAAGEPGALPSDRLGIGARGTGNTLLFYDAHPALRADFNFTFATPVTDLHEPDNDTQGTAGSMLQLCRNLNTLIHLENDPDGNFGATPDLHRFQYVLPRIWDGTTFWDDNANATNIQQRSTPVAFTVVRRAQQSYAGLDRQNTVDDPYDYATGPLDHRIYENPSTFYNQDIDCVLDGDRTEATTCYENQVVSVSLVELRQHLHRAGHCGEEITKIRNDQVVLRMTNDVTREYISGTVETGGQCLNPGGQPHSSAQTEAACNSAGGNWNWVPGGTQDLTSMVLSNIWYRFYHTAPTVAGNYSPQELCTSIAPGATVTLTTQVYDFAQDALRGVAFFNSPDCDITDDLIVGSTQLLLQPDPADLWFSDVDLSSGIAERHVVCAGDLENYVCTRQ